jgi:hypothetical protein
MGQKQGRVASLDQWDVEYREKQKLAATAPPQTITLHPEVAKKIAREIAWKLQMALPKDVLSLTFQYLLPDEIWSCRQVSKQWHAAATMSRSWRGSRLAVYLDDENLHNNSLDFRKNAGMLRYIEGLDVISKPGAKVGKIYRVLHYALTLQRRYAITSQTFQGCAPQYIFNMHGITSLQISGLLLEYLQGFWRWRLDLLHPSLSHLRRLDVFQASDLFLSQGLSQEVREAPRKEFLDALATNTTLESLTLELPKFSTKEMYDLGLKIYRGKQANGLLEVADLLTDAEIARYNNNVTRIQGHIDFLHRLATVVANHPTLREVEFRFRTLGSIWCVATWIIKSFAANPRLRNIRIHQKFANGTPNSYNDIPADSLLESDPMHYAYRNERLQDLAKKYQTTICEVLEAGVHEDLRIDIELPNNYWNASHTRAVEVAREKYSDNVDRLLQLHVRTTTI